jgi:8-oxo-dGTP pyrophosphatase MutT (NUDIX family)
MGEEPAVARPAATLILLRRGGKHADRGVEVLMGRRGAEASFMPNVWVFPGGIVEGGETPAQCAVRELEEETGIGLGPDAELLPWSRWITPELVSIRFDTHFFVALAPAHSPPKPDGVEITQAAWFAPSDALERHQEGEMELVFPTIKHLESLLPFANSNEVLAAARERPVEPILPKVVGVGSERRVVLPGDPGYP